MDTETAQVDPFEYTTKVFENSGAELVIDSVSQLIMSEKGECEGVLLGSGETLKADNTVVATGAWLAQLEDWGIKGLKVPITGIKSTSAVFEQPQEVTQDPYAVFCGEHSKFNTHLEIYPRNDGTVYTCGLGGSDHVRGDRLKQGGDCESADKIHENMARVVIATAALKEVSSVFQKEPVKV